jgi:RNA polymerase sigma factor (sigma-70 family)
MGPGPARAAVLTAYAKSLISHKAKQLCRKPGFSRSDEGDLVQDLTLSLLEKGDQYDPARGASLDTFADRVVNSEVKMILRARRREKRAAGFVAQSLQTDGHEYDGSIVPLAELIGDGDLLRRGAAAPINPISAIDNREALESAMAALDPSVVDIARRRQEQSVNAIHHELGISRRQINTAIEQIRRQFEEAGLGDE